MMGFVRYKKNNKTLHIGSQSTKLSIFFPTEYGRKFSVRLTINGNSYDWGGTS